MRRNQLKWLVMFIFFTLPILPVYAAKKPKISTSRVESILSQFPLQSNNVFSNVMRSIGWAAVVGLHWLVSGLESSIYSINDAIGGFFTSDAVIRLEQKVFPIAMALVAIVILYIGLLSMFKPPNFSNIVGNFIIGIIVFVALPCLLSNAYSFTTQAIQYINDNGNSTKIQELMSDKILVDNVTDTTRYDAEGFGSTNLKNKSYFAVSGANTSKIAGIDINELVNPDNMKYPDVWTNKLVTNSNGSTSLQGLNSGQYGPINLSVMSEYYYRWNVDWFTIFSTLIVTAAALLLSGIKIARLIYELAINQTMAQIMALLDFVTAQRLKKCIQLLISTLGTLFAIFFMLQMYILGMSYVSEHTGWNIFVKILVMLALAFAVVDGPNLFEQIFGIDAGIKSGMRTLYGLKAAGSIISGGAALFGGKAAVDMLRSKGVMGAAKGLLSGAGSVAGGAGGIAAGIAHGASENRERVNAVRQGSSGGVGQAAAAANVVGGAAGAVSDSVAGGLNGRSAGSVEQPSPNSVRSNAGPVSSSAARQSGAGNVGSAVPSSSAQGQSLKGVFQGQSDSGTAMPNAQAPSSYEREQPQSAESSYTARPNNSPDMSNAAEPENISSASQQSVQQSGGSPSAPVGSVGDYIRSKVTGGIQQSKPVMRTQRIYGLTRGSMQKRGDKLVDRETRAQSLMQNNMELSHHQAIKQAKHDIKDERISSRLNPGTVKK